jgi:hypothetical protein
MYRPTHAANPKAFLKKTPRWDKYGYQSARDRNNGSMTYTNNWGLAAVAARQCRLGPGEEEMTQEGFDPFRDTFRDGERGSPGDGVFKQTLPRITLKQSVDAWENTKSDQPQSKHGRRRSVVGRLGSTSTVNANTTHNSPFIKQVDQKNLL